MGAWGVEPFENDGAGDFEAELCELHASDSGFLRATLWAALGASDYLEIDSGQAAVAAAAVVAALNGYAEFDCSPRLRTWIERHRPSPAPALVPLALAALAAATGDAEHSELVDCWLGASDFAAWNESVRSLSAYLRAIRAQQHANEAKLTIEQRVYTYVRCSDADRDGMALEIIDITINSIGEDVLEVFYRDADGRMTLTAYRPNLPVELIEWSLRQAHELLPPLPDSPA
ncbi:MAG TPA: DUF4259 domain-containing protein [Herpetosiphonaceae bacterium]|nr:DUF4259 domain-containing protein [Herpetosiphonaceae bacterium]